MVARALMLTDGALFTYINKALEFFGPFIPSFLTDSKVWVILHLLFGTASMWQHLKKFTSAQNG
jgi:hypothetical protein